MIAHEVYAQLSTPLLWRFLREMPARGDEWAAALIDRLTAAVRRPSCRRCGRCGSPGRRRRRSERWLASGEARLATCCAIRRTATSRCTRSCCWCCADGEATLAPDDDFVLEAGDELLLAGWPAARRALGTILFVDGVLEYVVTGRRVPSSWIWRKLARPRCRRGCRASWPA